MPASSPRVAEMAYLVEMAKDWTVSCFASAQSSEFMLAPHRFEITEMGVRRRRVKPGSLEAVSPLDAVTDVSNPTAWSHGTVVTLLVDYGSRTSAVEQEVVEILALDGDFVLAEAAGVIRIEGLPPCLGAFRAPT
ncbi:MAG: hypothetical protein JO168_26475 [Solirubrobacterales bacterium]|nr:hypothetical protein [Solirubrobacterales bacterium]